MKCDYSLVDLPWKISIINLFEYLPITINSIGIREYLTILLLGSVNNTASKLITFCMLNRVLYILCSSVGAIMAFKRVN